jgi:predicted DNA-binding transcriptional regulator AlpA
VRAAQASPGRGIRVSWKVTRGSNFLPDDKIVDVRTLRQEATGWEAESVCCSRELEVSNGIGVLYSPNTNDGPNGLRAWIAVALEEADWKIRSARRREKRPQECEWEGTRKQVNSKATGKMPRWRSYSTRSCDAFVKRGKWCGPWLELPRALKKGGGRGEWRDSAYRTWVQRQQDRQ